jgi:hypothetical protein
MEGAGSFRLIRDERIQDRRRVGGKYVIGAKDRLQVVLNDGYERGGWRSRCPEGVKNEK